jgi:hypothetical protein
VQVANEKSMRGWNVDKACGVYFGTGGVTHRSNFGMMVQGFPGCC